MAIAQFTITKDNLCQAVHGISMSDAQSVNICVECRSKIHNCTKDALTPGGIYSEAGQSEYRISGLCEHCFDTIVHEDDEELGIEEGDTCRRNGCPGILDVRTPENCSCHINPPCSACTTDRTFCPECGWAAGEE